MILKYIQEENGQKFAEVTFTSIEVDAPLDASIFTVPPDYHPTEQP